VPSPWLVGLASGLHRTGVHQLSSSRVSATQVAEGLLQLAAANVTAPAAATSGAVGVMEPMECLQLAAAATAVGAGHASACTAVLQRVTDRLKQDHGPSAATMIAQTFAEHGAWHPAVISAGQARLAEVVSALTPSAAPGHDQQQQPYGKVGAEISDTAGRSADPGQQGAAPTDIVVEEGSGNGMDSHSASTDEFLTLANSLAALSPVTPGAAHLVAKGFTMLAEHSMYTASQTREVQGSWKRKRSSRRHDIGQGSALVTGTEQTSPHLRPLTHMEAIHGAACLTAMGHPQLGGDYLLVMAGLNQRTAADTGSHVTSSSLQDRSIPPWRAGGSGQAKGSTSHHNTLLTCVFKEPQQYYSEVYALVMASKGSTAVHHDQYMEQCAGTCHQVAPGHCMHLTSSLCTVATCSYVHDSSSCNPGSPQLACVASCSPTQIWLPCVHDALIPCLSHCSCTFPCRTSPSP
jgi:hypothetical protein